jgi:hypothetical protein
MGVESGTRGKVSFPSGLVMCPTNLQRYNRLLLDKRRELSFAQGDTHARVPAARIAFKANGKMVRGADWSAGDET